MKTSYSKPVIVRQRPLAEVTAMKSLSQKLSKKPDN